MSARSLIALGVHEGAAGGVSEHWRSMEKFGAGLLTSHDVERLVQRTLADLSWIYARFKECRGFWFGEAQSMVFHVSGKLWEAQAREALPL